MKKKIHNYQSNRIFPLEARRRGRFDGSLSLSRSSWPLYDAPLRLLGRAHPPLAGGGDEKGADVSAATRRHSFGSATAVRRMRERGTARIGVVPRTRRATGLPATKAATAASAAAAAAAAVAATTTTVMLGGSRERGLVTTTIGGGLTCDDDASGARDYRGCRRVGRPEAQLEE